MTELSTLVNPDGMVSSRLVAEKFSKRHDNVLRDFQHLKNSLPSDFVALAFEERRINTLKASKTELSEVLMTRDGFALMAMGFTGHAALKWKVRFLNAFRAMEETIRAELPSLRSEIARLKQDNLLLNAPKKTHGNKGLVPAIMVVETLFATENELRRVDKNDPRVSDIAKLEGKARQMMSVSCGMQKEAIKIFDEISVLRRK